MTPCFKTHSSRASTHPKTWRLSASRPWRPWSCSRRTASAVDQWTLARLPESLTEQEREDVVRGCYEMLMVLAEAVAQPLPGESSTVASSRGASRSWNAPSSCSASRLMPIT